MESGLIVDLEGKGETVTSYTAMSLQMCGQGSYLPHRDVPFHLVTKQPHLWHLGVTTD